MEAYREPLRLDGKTLGAVEEVARLLALASTWEACLAAGLGLIQVKENRGPAPHTERHRCGGMCRLQIAVPGWEAASLVGMRLEANRDCGLIQRTGWGAQAVGCVARLPIAPRILAWVEEVVMGRVVLEWPAPEGEGGTREGDLLVHLLMRHNVTGQRVQAYMYRRTWICSACVMGMRVSCCTRRSSARIAGSHSG